LPVRVPENHYQKVDSMISGYPVISVVHS
ncbi:MAG: hypothetical protein RIQ94_3484, partial [Pseudomonadota bacterium]